MKVAIYFTSHNWTPAESSSMDGPVEVIWKHPHLPRKGDLLDFENGVPEIVTEIEWRVDEVQYTIADGKTIPSLWLEEEKS